MTQPLSPGRKLALQIIVVVGIGALVLIGFAWWATAQAQQSEDRQTRCLSQSAESYLECITD